MIREGIPGNIKYYYTGKRKHASIFTPKEKQDGFEGYSEESEGGRG